MKATFEYDLIEDGNQFKIACTAIDWALTVEELDNMLRDMLKNGHNHKTADSAIQDIRDRLNNTMAHYNISLSMLA